MSFLKRLASIFTGGGQGGDRRWLTIYVLSRRCNEPISAEVDLLNSLSQAEEDDATFYTRKVLQGTGAKRCFTQVEVELWFDSNRKLLRNEVHGGRWLTQEEYDAELARFNAPPEEDEDSEDERPEDARPEDKRPTEE
jgi:hypothetical protein